MSESAVAEPEKKTAKSPFRRYLQGPDDKEPREVPNTDPDGVFRVEDPRTYEQVLKGDVPKPLTQEDRDKIYGEMREKALIDYHVTRAKALVGHPESYSLDEIQKISDLFPMRTLTFDSWWQIQLARQTEAMQAQQNKTAPPDQK